MTGEHRELVRRAIDARIRELVPYVGNRWDLDVRSRVVDVDHFARDTPRTSELQRSAIDAGDAEAGGSPPGGRPRRRSGSILELALAASLRPSQGMESTAPT